MPFFINAYIQRFLKRFGLQIKKVRDPFADIQRLVSPFKISAIIDGGAYHGVISKQLLSLSPNTIVYAFEPYKVSFAILEHNINNTTNIKPINYAISSTSGKREFYVTEKTYCSSLLKRARFGEKYYPEPTNLHCIEIVDVITLDEWAKEEGVPCIDIIKLDLQGHELEALKGATELLRSTVRLVYTEVGFIELYENNCLFFQLEEFFRNNGFYLYQLYNLKTGEDGQLIYGDGIFINRSRVKL
jgi:FkbM family methyltransferase